MATKAKKVVVKKIKVTDVMYKGKPTTRGKRMTVGPYRLLNIGNNSVFAGSLIDTFNIGKKRIAIFSVPTGS